MEIVDSELIDVLASIYYEGKKDIFMKSILESKDDGERVALAYSFISDTHFCQMETSIDLSPPFSIKNNFKRGKCFETAKKYRIDGYNAFMQEPPNVIDALLNYTKSIASTPYPFNQNASDLNELTLAFGGRSAVLYRIHSYEECLSDIEQALMLGYPTDQKHELFKRKGECLRAIGKVEEAIESFEEVSDYLLVSVCNAKQKKKIKQQVKKHLVFLKSIGMGVEQPNFKQKRRLRPPPNKFGGDNKKVPNASDCIEICVHNNWGRHLKTTKDIRPGEVLMVEKPFVSILEATEYKIRCYNCLKKYDALIPCKTCSVAMFCSVHCRDTAWTASHEIECPMLFTLNENKASSPMLTSLRMLIVAIKQNKGVLELHRLVQEIEKTEHGIKGLNKMNKYESTDYFSVHNMYTGAICEGKDPMVVIFAMQCAFVLNCIMTKSKALTDTSNIPSDLNYWKFISSLLMRYRRIISMNSLEICDLGPPNRKTEKFNLEQAMCFGVYPTASLLNHSCVPNALFYCRGDNLVLISSLPIAAGEQIFISYEWWKGYLMNWSSKQRQVSLQKRYFFTCKCRSCLHKLPEFESHMRLLCPQCHSSLPDSVEIAKCRTCKKKTNVSGLRQGLHKLIERLRKLRETSRDEKKLPEICALISTLSKSADLTYEVIMLAQNLLRSTCGQAGAYFLD